MNKCLFFAIYLTGLQLLPGQTPATADTRLMEAIRAKNTDAMEKALLEGASRNTLNSPEAAKIFSTYTETEYNNTVSTLQRFIAERLLSKTEKLNQDLFAAVKTKDIDQISRLLKCGADPNAKGSGGRTALSWASMFEGDPKVIQTLVRGGADVNAMDLNGDTPLSLAVQFGGTNNIPAIQELLRNGADSDAKNRAGYSPGTWIHSSIPELPISDHARQQASEAAALSQSVPSVSEQKMPKWPFVVAVLALAVAGTALFFRRR